MSTIVLNGSTTDIVLRSEKEAELTFAELDGNFANLAAKANEIDDSIADINDSLGQNAASIASIMSDLSNLAVVVGEKAGVADIPSLTQIIEDIDYLKNKIVTQIIVDDNDNVIEGQPIRVNDDAPYLNVPRLAPLAQYGQLNDDLLNVSTTITGDYGRMDVEIIATKSSDGSNISLDDCYIIHIGYLLETLKYAQKAYFNGKLIFENGKLQNGVYQLGKQPLILVFANENSTTSVNIPLNAAIDFNIEGNVRAFEVTLSFDYEGIELDHYTKTWPQGDYSFGGDIRTGINYIDNNGTLNSLSINEIDSVASENIIAGSKASLTVAFKMIGNLLSTQFDKYKEVSYTPSRNDSSNTVLVTDFKDLPIHTYTKDGVVLSA